MSAETVVQIFKDRLQNNLPAGFQFVETLNVRPGSLPERFISLEYDYSSTDRITLGTPTQFRENGSITVQVKIPSGKGEAELRSVIEVLRDLFHNYDVGFYHTVAVGSAAVRDSDNGNFAEMIFSVVYWFDFFKP